MEVQILTKKDNPLLKRVEVTFKAVHKAEGTPARDAMRSELAKQLKATKDVVVIDRVESSFGRYESVGYAKVYPSKEVAVSIERHHILVRNRLAAAEVKEAKAAEAPPKPEAKPAPKKEEGPKPEAKPAKPEHKPEAKAEHKAERKPEHKEPKAEAKPEKPHAKEEKKAEHKPEAKKAEPKKKEGK